MAIITPDETVLGLLADQPRHGYELLEVFNTPDQLGEVWNLSTSQLYAVLKRLEQQAFITGTRVTSDHAPPRIEYTLTPEGKNRLLLWLYEKHPSASVRRIRVEFLSRLYIARRLNLADKVIIQYQQTACEQHLAELRLYHATFSPGIGQTAVDMVITQLEAIIIWLNRC
ncbi:MAG: PadR family transcriptional regulator [Anaerolineae bacterium]|nr:PadR family transcriptional regulator [Anaerolineae bacterium]